MHAYSSDTKYTHQKLGNLPTPPQSDHDTD